MIERKPSLTILAILLIGAITVVITFTVYHFYLPWVRETCDINNESTPIQPPIQYTLDLSVVGQGTTVPVPGSHVYEEGTRVTIKAYTAVSWVFDHWTMNGVDYADNPITVVIDADVVMVANYLKSTHPPPPPPPAETILFQDDIETNPFWPEERLSVYVSSSENPNWSYESSRSPTHCVEIWRCTGHVELAVDIPIPSEPIIVNEAYWQPFALETGWKFGNYVTMVAADETLRGRVRWNHKSGQSIGSLEILVNGSWVSILDNVELMPASSWYLMRLAVDRITGRYLYVEFAQETSPNSGMHNWRHHIELDYPLTKGPSLYDPDPTWGVRTGWYAEHIFGHQLHLDDLLILGSSHT